MGDRFHQISMEALTDWVFDELEQKDQLFGVPRSAFWSIVTAILTALGMLFAFRGRTRHADSSQDVS